ncbi:hypothetical protein [Deefgea sp. CFH1-16]|uniref:hypothetical protein n=1 Tax=Deefgea sp. CFH1-16 TaxID=2675457 RepID=UPI0015F5DDE3|nr:hypothetical protein [Deefgea sp. CFH1-16]MBM5573173.1 hypothetical protein [Deefgea sp. CFH1-16]
MKKTSPLKLSAFFVPFIITCLLSFLSAIGVVRAKELLGEQLVPNTFELFAYISLIFTGLAGAFHPKAKTLLCSASKGIGICITNLAFGASGALVGWGFGLLIATAPSSSPQQLVSRIGLVSFMALITIVPAWAFEQIMSARSENEKNLFRPETYNLAFRLLMLVVSCTGVYGFYKFWWA